jgi:hypothetical protein
MVAAAMRALVVIAMMVSRCGSTAPKDDAGLPHLPPNAPLKRAYKGQVLASGRLAVEPANTMICLDVRNGGADPFVAHVSMGGYIADVSGPPSTSFQLCVQDMADKGAEVKVIADAVMEGPISVTVGTVQKLQ